MKKADDPFWLRRWLAITSFSHVLLIIYICFAIVFFGSEGIEIRLQAAAPILMIIVPSLIANVAQYMLLVHKSDSPGVEDG